MAGAGIIANGVTEILKVLVSVVANEIIMVQDFPNELKNLQTTLNMILVVMEDAEMKQASNEAVRLWMGELKSIAYDAEEILDEYAYEVILHNHEKKKDGKSNFLSKVRNGLSNSKFSYIFSRNLAYKVCEINEKFNKIGNDKAKLGLQTIDVGSSSHELMMKNRETISFVPKDWEIVGRENDKSAIIKMLLEEENTSNNQGGGSKHVSVIPIVGMGGLGKTTMAQQVYNDEAIKKHFELKIWICVSHPFDIKKLWINIGKSIREQSIEGKEYDNAKTMDAIAHLLKDDVKGKKFILVLDDVWNEKPEYWNNFKNPFMVGRGGSKILVTTRNKKVASIMMDKFPPYPLRILNDNDCWSLFKKIAFGSEVGETPKLVEIGKEMVNRCKGLPLAIIFLGSLMRSKKKVREWKIIRDTKLWHQYEILPSLRLSYDYLPSHLKLCFSYCCLFPKDWIIDRETLIRLWMAEGFLIEKPGETKSLEEIGNEYFHSLLSNFFVLYKDGDIATCKMHDLVHDLACSVTGNHEYLIIENALDIDYISEETRRLNLLFDLNDEEILPKVLKALKKAKNLRTIFINTQEICFDIRNAFEKNKKLRVLNLSGSILTSESTSSSFGGLKHLRYLDVKGAKGIGGLSFLQTLTKFTVGDKEELSNGGIEELECLNNLRGNLTIYSLQNVESGTAACRANLKDKKKLVGLNLTWYGNERYPINNHEVVLEGLRPHPNLRTLEIQGFEGSKLPRWMGDSSSCLPKLENLTLLFGMSEQVAGFGVLPSLRSLNLACMSALKEWVVRPPSTTSICFPLLEEMIILYCPLLSTITPTTTMFPSLKVLILYCIDGRAAKTLVTNNLNSLTSLTLGGIPNLITLPRQGLIENNNTLLSLEIGQCPEFKGFLLPNMDEDEDEDERDGDGDVVSSSSSSSSSSSCSSLQSLTLYDCPALRFYPNIRSLTSLRELVIQDCKESKSLLTSLFSSSFSLKHLEYVKIWKNQTAAEREEVPFKWWRRKSSLSSSLSAYMVPLSMQPMLPFKARLIDIGMRCWWFPCSLLDLEGVRFRDECSCVWRMLLCLCLWLVPVLSIITALC